MSLALGSTLVSAFAIFFIGTLVYFHNRKSATNVLFFLMGLATLLWSVANFYSVSTDTAFALTAIRFVLFFATPHAVLFLLFTLTFPNTKITISKYLFGGALLSMFAVMGATVSPFVFKSIEITESGVVPHPGILMPLFAITVLGSLILSLIVMIKKYAKGKDDERIRWKFMLIGTSLSYILLIFTNFVLVVFYQNTFFTTFGPLFMLPTFVGMTYAILRHKLFSIKAVSAEMLTFIILSISLLQIFTSETSKELIIQISLFVTFFIFGLFLIRSVIKEVEAREEIEGLAHSLEKANIRLKELDRQKSEFVSIASHQLRSPLTAIKGYASLILEGSFGNVSKGVREAVQKIFDSSGLMVVSVQDFLDVSRIEQGRMKYNMETFDIKKLLRIVVEELTPTAAKKKLALTFDGNDDDTYTVNADYGKMKQIFSNLIDNAIKYTPKGSITARIEKIKNASKILISISDTGVGLSRETRMRLFDKFVRAKNAHEVNVSGTGLGLYVVKEMITVQNGSVWVESKGEGKGSSFYIMLNSQENIG